MQLISLLSPYISALILTLVIEGALCFLIKRSNDWLKFSCLVNLFTNPLVNFVYAIIFLALQKQDLTESAPWILLGLEIIVWLSESRLFYRFSLTRDNEQNEPVSSIYKALLFSFVLNATSYGTGLLLQL